jgi:hypothetical protein
MIMSDVDLEFYLKHHGMFLSDFWTEGNKDLQIGIEPRSNVESGQWYTATWHTANGAQRLIEAQRWKLVWERIVKQYLKDETRTRAARAHDETQERAAPAAAPDR